MTTPRKNHAAIIYSKEEVTQEDIQRLHKIAAEINEANTVYVASILEDGYKATLTMQTFESLDRLVDKSIEYSLSRKKAHFPGKTGRACSFNNFTIGLKYYKHIVDHYADQKVDKALLESYLADNLKIKQNYITSRCRILVDQYGFTKH